MTKVYFIESTDMYEDIGYCGGVGYFSEEEANRVEKEKAEHRFIGYSYMVHELNVKYSHRNGESDLPTEMGYYWIEDGEDPEYSVNKNGKFLYLDCLEHHWRETDKLAWVLHDENPSEKARYWGPIPEPQLE